MTPAGPPVSELQEALDEHSDHQKRAWWTRYLKGQAQFRGVPTAAIRAVTRAWWERHDGDAFPPEAQLATCLELLHCPLTEDKLAGMLLLGERLIPAGRVSCEIAVPRFADQFAEGHLADWNTVDWFCVRVLGPLIEQGGDRCARAVAAWVESEVLWQRRAALVGFVNLAPRGAHAPLIIETAERLVVDHERFAQTGVAWVLRELRRARPDLVERFIEQHHDDMSREALKQVRGRHR